MDERTMEALASGEPCGSGGPLTDDHVICPGCAHNFAAISQSSRERIAELEAALQPFANLGHEIEQLAASAPAGDPASDVSNWAKACFWEDLASAMRALKPTTPAE